MPPSNVGKKSPNRLQQQRNGLLKIVHVAKRELGLTEDEYLAVLSSFGAASSGALSIPELEQLIKYFKRLGFQKRPGKSGGPLRRKAIEKQIAALKERIVDEASQVERGDRRLAGLVKSKCGVDRLEWVNDPGKLKQLLLLMRMIRENRLEE